ncbi:MAG TPA: Mur ligase domain-containing protein [Caldisericia bacterium]|nr:Mur ligase domain-containing protein [Caldisericia bacterium]HPF48248.1 Mur ligase domain-containing protein [Caldisericia bacterium]HPI83816.1 Mur ligase domain-containing protein [Caldisericia bacterium]HPQ92701.1 Mur ligase domain-containing protein [Caldisericia bacterium]HRV74201.1 Mur ligase domain-containing protein [Caldisericia bacterium]
MTNLLDLPKGSEIHFVGIGGTGLRAIAIMLHNLGYKVTGSDIEITRPWVVDLMKSGIKVHGGHCGCNIGNPALVIRSVIIPDNNPEITVAKEKNIPIIDKTEALVQIACKKDVLAVAGSHGKSTVTSMIAHIVNESGIDASWFFGSTLTNGMPEAKLTDTSKWLILETDESDHGFIKYNPKISVITNIDPEHMEFYDFKFENLVAEFKQFADTAASNGGIQVLSADCATTLSTQNGSSGNSITFGESESANIRCDGVQFFEENGHLCSRATVLVNGRAMGELKLIVPGIHNIKSALAAIATSAQLGVSISDAIKHLGSYPGLTRRIELIANVGGHLVFDDDAGHPTELQAGMKTLKDYFPNRPICIIHQPVRHSRVFYLSERYAKAACETLTKGDRYIGSPAAATDENKWNVSRHGVTDAISKASPPFAVEYAASSDEIPKLAFETMKDSEVFFVSGHPPHEIRGAAQKLAALIKDNKK